MGGEGLSKLVGPRQLILDLSHNNFGAGGISALGNSGVGDPTSLTLDLSRCRLSTDDFDRLGERLAKFPELMSLTLRMGLLDIGEDGTPIIERSDRPNGAAHLCSGISRLIGCTMLTSLSLHVHQNLLSVEDTDKVV